jgi:hypothetical protein
MCVPYVHNVLTSSGCSCAASWRFISTFAEYCLDERMSGASCGQYKKSVFDVYCMHTMQARESNMKTRFVC